MISKTKELAQPAIARPTTTAAVVQNIPTVANVGNSSELPFNRNSPFGNAVIDAQGDKLLIRVVNGVVQFEKIDQQGNVK